MHAATDSTLGGILIASCVFYHTIVYGSVLGISGMLSDVVLPFSNTFPSAYFLAGLIFSGYFLPLHSVTSSFLPLLALSGFLVGFGTRLGNGCTSGHGLCGLARRSERSVFAVITFMSFGMLSRVLTVSTSTTIEIISSAKSPNPVLSIYFGIAFLFFSMVAAVCKLHFGDIFSATVRFTLGTVFANGLILGGMTDPNVVLSFLSLPYILRSSEMFDPALVFVLLAGLLPNLALHPYIARRKATLLGRKFKFPTFKSIDLHLFVGQASFGIGWGIAGLCPGPAVVLLGNLLCHGVSTDTYWILCWWAGMVIGTFVATLVK